jgi:DNA-binding NarL/FixJ family response regulator
MILFCCSANLSLLERWQRILGESHTVYQATQLEDINVLLKQKISPELMILHADLVDPENTLRLRQSLPTCRLFVLSDRPDDHEGIRYLAVGAVGYGNSYIAPARIREAVQVIANGSVWMGQKLMARLIQTSRQQVEVDGKKVTEAEAGKNRLFRKLSSREYQIARLVAEGLSNSKISDQLGITERTVKAHLSSIYRKTGTKGRLNLALLLNQPDR